MTGCDLERENLHVEKRKMKLQWKYWSESNALQVGLKKKHFKKRKGFVLVRNAKDVCCP